MILYKDNNEWFASMKKEQTEAKIKRDINLFDSNGRAWAKHKGIKYNKPKIVYLLYVWQNISCHNKNLIGAYTTKREALYYCIGLNKNEKSENIIYYIHPFYVNTNFYQGDANGNYKIPEYKPRKR